MLLNSKIVVRRCQLLKNASILNRRWVKVQQPGCIGPVSADKVQRFSFDGKTARLLSESVSPPLRKAFSEIDCVELTISATDFRFTDG